MEIGVVLPFLFNGIVLGLIFAVVALGFTLILGVMEVINFAHGGLFAVGCYLAFTLQQMTNFWVGLILAPLIVGVLGVLIERFSVRRVYGEDPLFGLLVTFGIYFVIEESIRIIWGPAGYSVTAPSFVSGAVNLGFMYYSKYRLFLALISVGIIIGVWMFLEKTPYGGVIKAGAIDSEMVMALGHNLPKLRMFVFGFGAALAGIAGVIAAPLWGVRPTVGVEVLMPSFVIVVLGGIGSFWGSVIGGLLVGISTSLMVLFFPRASDIIPYLLMTVILILRPRGLMGEKSILEE
ncbi:branched-chain amino acid ABC transporter permease [Candidatus Aerophobetes bacterium]|nr:branched-chain amino acid ABC transporter permease [Candidatus Aerophobetes bacterium]